jgi:hypothetical protein
MIRLAAIIAVLSRIVLPTASNAGTEAPKPHQAFMAYWLGYAPGGASLQATPATPSRWTF